MVFSRSGISSGNPADDAKLADILPKWLSCATKLEIRQATLKDTDLKIAEGSAERLIRLLH